MFCFASLCFYIIKIVLTCAVYNFFDSFLSLFASSSTQKLCINSIVPYLLCSILILFSFELSRMDFYMCFFFTSSSDSWCFVQLLFSSASFFFISFSYMWSFYLLLFFSLIFIVFHFGFCIYLFIFPLFRYVYY